MNIDNEIYIGTRAAAFDNEDTLWISDFKYGGLYRYHLGKRDLHSIHYFGNTEVMESQLHEEMIFRDDKLYMISNDDKYLMRIYDIPNKEESIPVWAKNRQGYYGCRISTDKMVFFIKENGCTIIDYYINDNREDYNENASERIRNYLNYKYDDARFFLSKNWIIIWLSNRKKLIRLDPSYNIVDSFCLGELKNDIYKIYYEGGEYWIMFMNQHNILSCDQNGRTIIDYTIDDPNLIESQKRYEAVLSLPIYASMTLYNEQAVFSNYYGNSIVVASRKIGKLERVFSEYFDYKVNPTDRLIGGCYPRIIEHNSHLYFLPCLADRILEMDENYDVVDSYKMRAHIDPNRHNEMLRFTLKNGLVRENDLFGLSTFVSTMCNQNEEVIV